MIKNQKIKKDQKIGDQNHINKNCWLAKNVGYPPSSRCRYCELKFNQCLFSRYLLITLVLVGVLFLTSYIVEKNISKTLIGAIIVLVLAYGYFFNKSTETIVKANFEERRAKEAFKDLTAHLKQKVNEQTRSLQNTNKELGAKNLLNEELLNMKTDFLHVVNHQLNTPISIVKGAFSMMEEGDWSKDRAMQNIKSGFERITQTVSDFWDAYELEGEKMKMNPEETDLAAVVEKLIPEKQRLQLAQERKLAVKVNKPDFVVPKVWCDARKITHVVSNLLDNAVFYTPQGGVTVDFKKAGDKLKISIIDTGVGISEENKKRLFQKFSRGQGATNLHPDGSGLGLYIAKKIVESNDGELTYESEGLGKGSTFSFTLPVYKKQTKAEELKNLKEKKIIIFKTKK